MQGTKHSRGYPPNAFCMQISFIIIKSFSEDLQIMPLLLGFTEFTNLKNHQNDYEMILYLLQQYGKHELHFTDLTFDDSGMYQCIAENSHGVIHANAELRIFGKLLNVRWGWKDEDPMLFSKSVK